MATYNASQGLIKVAGNTLGELKSFSFSRTATTIETSNMASSAMTYAVGKTSFSGSAEAFWDNDDTGQNALTEGTLLEIHFFSSGTQHNIAGLSFQTKGYRKKITNQNRASF